MVEFGSARFQLVIGNLSILAGHSPPAWKKLEYHKLDQGFKWKHPQR